jgi:2-polyprenyl-3-methyl-5-hydroxy-6-metoxy-1,4-benzoquinol methylase
VLDLGCGTGVASIAAAERGLEVVGIDHSEAMLGVARAKAADARVAERCEFRIGDVRRVDAPDASFDAVVCQGVLHHLADIRPCLSELARVLRPGGAFFLSEPSGKIPALRAGAARAHMALRRSRTEPPTAPGEAPLDPDLLRAELDALGLEHEIRFLFFFGRVASRLPPSAYMRLVRALSFPSRRRAGDLFFVRGRKPR